jgi:hypothetical protein
VLTLCVCFPSVDDETAYTDSGIIVANTCIRRGQACASDIDECCNGMLCVLDQIDDEATCAELCLEHDDCESGCCRGLATDDVRAKACAGKDRCGEGGGR